MKKLKVGISIGDLNGIGPEVILKTLMHPRITNICVPIIYGSSKVVSYHKNIVKGDFQFRQSQDPERVEEDRINVINCWQENVNITLGQPTEDSGKYAYKSLDSATQDLKRGKIDSLVTGPINKEAMKVAKFPYTGHTEYLTRQFGMDESLMLMINDDLRIGLATNHLPIQQVSAAITKDLLLRKIQLLDESLKRDFGIERPTIAVMGLNPHAGDGGVIGEEDEKLIRPAVVDLKKGGQLIFGPYPADGFFGSGQHKKFDGILAMYHDQGLVPFKLLSFGKGVNFTAGLPGIRTSPDHGTAYDIAGKNQADPSSFRQALFSAIDIARNRRNYLQMHENKVISKSEALKSGEDETVEEDQ